MTLRQTMVRSMRTGLGLIFAMAALLHGAPAYSSGATDYTTYCSGCHNDPPAAGEAPLATQGNMPLNGAGAQSVIDFAIGAGMTGAPPAGVTAGIAAYLAGFLPANNPNNRAIPFNSAGVVINIPNLSAMPSFWGALTGISTVSGPSKGTVTYNAAAGTMTYKPNAGQFGPDSWQYHGTGPGGPSSTRTATVTIANPPPPVVTPSTQAAQTGVFFTFNVSATNSPTSYAVASGSLPPGLGLNTASGVISGTPTTVGGFTANITATNAGGTGAAAAITINVSLGPPVITSGTPPTGAEGVAYAGYTITASNSPTLYGVIGTLPPGLALNTATGLISGTPSLTAGPYPQNYPVTVQATNGTGTGSAARTFTINKPVPSVTSAATASGQTGVAFSYAITATQGPLTSFSAAGLPPGLVLNAGTGVISGTPTTVGGPTSVTVTATNSTGTSPNFNLAITITLGPPVITSATSASAGEGQAFSYQITATNPPLTGFNATGLPPGLSVNTATGLISGTVSAGAAAGSPYSVAISATNSTSTGNATLTISVSQFAPVVTSAGTASGQTGAPFSYQITASNAPTAFNATGLPSGLSVNTATGLISGTPTAVGSFGVTMSASNGSGSNAKPLTITITLGAPVVTSPATASGAVASPFSYQITATNSPTSFNASGLPAGLTVNTASGLISGTPTASGSFSVTVSATNATATASQPVTFSIAIGPPVLTSAGSATTSVGAAFFFQITATNSPTSFSASGLPPGLTVDTTTGIISGSATASGGFIATIGATNGSGSASGTLAIVVSQAAAVVTSPAVASASVGTPFTYVLTFTNAPGTVTATNLPPGLAFDATTNTIQGTPTVGGTFPVTLAVTNSVGTVSFKLTINVAFAIATVGDLDVQVPYEQATPITLPIAGQFTGVSIVTLPDHGLVAVQGAVVTYTPAQGFSGSDRFQYSATNPSGVSTIATVRITVGSIVPVASAVAMTVNVNASATADLAASVKASGLTGVSIGTKPAHGTVLVNGTKVTYTPKTDYFGVDSFTYIAYGNAGNSGPAVVSVTIIGRPDPSANADVAGLVDAQTQAARRFSNAQLGNFQRRMETLHDVAPPAGSQRTAERDGAPGVGPIASTATVAGSPRSDSPASSWTPIGLLSPLAGLAGGGGTALNGDTGGALTGVQAWIAGTAQFGRRNADGVLDGLRFSTDGISVGIDRRFGSRLVLGLGVGYGRDDSDIGTDGTRSKARGHSFALYGSWQPAGSLFVDILAGVGRLDFDSRRRVQAIDQFATGTRKGEQTFASVSVGADLRGDFALLAPYARVDVARDRLDAFAESGVGDFALAFRQQTLRSTQVAAGVRMESVHDTDFGKVLPRARAEYRRELESQGTATLAYADFYNNAEYTLTPRGSSRNALLLGFGADLEFRGGLRFGFDWVAQRQGGSANVQGVRLLVSQELDGRSAPSWSWQPRMFTDPVGVEAGYTFDSNVTRGRPGEERADRVFSLGVGEPIPFKLGSITTLRLVVTPSVTGEKFERYAGLGRASVGGQAELQYRSSGAFDATTYALVGRASYDQYESYYRRGWRGFVGANARRAITDRIDLFAEAGRNLRDGRSDVFDTRDWAAKLNVDYSLGRRGVLYLAGEYRHGDIVSTGPPSLANVSLAEVFVPDDAYPGEGLLAYRFQGRTVLGTLGWNYPLGPRDSFDLSWRHVQSTPLHGWGAEGGSIHYNVNQYSLVYLMRF